MQMIYVAVIYQTHRPFFGAAPSQDSGCQLSPFSSLFLPVSQVAHSNATVY